MTKKSYSSIPNNSAANLLNSGAKEILDVDDLLQAGDSPSAQIVSDEVESERPDPWHGSHGAISRPDWVEGRAIGVVEVIVELAEWID